MIDERTEWLEADGLGGFASGTVAGPRTRRYHALLLAATTPPTGRMVLVNGLDAFVETPAGTAALSSQRYQPGVVAPSPGAAIESFTPDPWPAWIFAAPDGTRIRQEILVQRDTGTCVIAWQVLTASGVATVVVRPYLSGRDYHSLHHENGAFRFEPERRRATLAWRPYDGVPAICTCTNGRYTHSPEWYRNFLYAVERERGLDDTEDLAAPGTFTFVLEKPGAEAVMILSAGEALLESSAADPETLARGIRDAERRRRSQIASPLARAADAYLVKRGSGRSIVAGYPWFTDWGRDTFIALRGLCLASGRLADARDILVEWSGAVSEGMLPNRFPDAGEQPEFNAVDASLWFVVAAHELLSGPAAASAALSPDDRARLHAAVLSIVEGYARGTRFGIRADADGLLAAGVPGVQLTWMDARVGDRVITPASASPWRCRRCGSMRCGRPRRSTANGPTRSRGRAGRSASASGTRRAAACSTWWTRTTRPARWIPPWVRTRFSRSAGCRSPSSKAIAPGPSSTAWSASCSPRPACDRWRGRSRATRRSTRVGRPPATRRITRAPCGRG